jgi:hypothetical protein
MNETHENEMIPCETCGKPTRYLGTKRCDACWEVERRLEDYIKTPGGRAFVEKLVRQPTLDDWVDNIPDAWDYEKVLRDNDVIVRLCVEMINGDGVVSECPPDLQGWSLHWKNGCIHIGKCSEIHARKAAALFIELWQRGVSASFADKLMSGFLWYLELREGNRLTFLVQQNYTTNPDNRFMLLTRFGFCEQRPLNGDLQKQILDVLCPDLNGPPKGEEIVVTFNRRLA